jgi:hypothetical protein
MVKKLLQKCVLGLSAIALMYGCANKDISSEKVFSPQGDSLSTKIYLDSLIDNNLVSENHKKTFNHMFDKKYFNKDLYTKISKNNISNKQIEYISFLTEYNNAVNESLLDSILTYDENDHNKAIIIAGLNNTSINDNSIINYVKENINIENISSSFGIYGLLVGNNDYLYKYKKVMNFNEDDFFKSQLISLIPYLLKDKFVDSNKLIQIQDVVLNYNGYIDENQSHNFIACLEKGSKNLSDYNCALKVDVFSKIEKKINK